MSKGSESVKNWRKRTKQRIVESMGGECVCCSYKKCISALDLHHINPTEKEFALSSVRANSVSWSRIVNELRKCVLVCQNCHKEIHAGERVLPENPTRFNESYADYRKTETDVEYDKCPICGKNKPIYRKACSKECQQKCRVDWSQYNIVDELKTQSVYQVSQKYGLCYSSLYKYIKKNNIETPIIPSGNKVERNFVKAKTIPLSRVQPKTDKCPICGKTKLTSQKTCSQECSQISRSKFNWQSVDLIEETKHFSNVELGKKYGVSETQIRKQLKKQIK